MDEEPVDASGWPRSSIVCHHDLVRHADHLGRRGARPRRASCAARVSGATMRRAARPPRARPTRRPAPCCRRSRSRRRARARRASPRAPPRAPPRSLNEPIGCRHSSFSRISHGASTSSDTSGVRTHGVAEPLARALDLGERDQSDCFASSVSSVRTRQSSGYSLFLIRPASSSTGVPCVPTTSSPMIAPDHLHVPEAPDADLLVPVRQVLGELVEILVLAALRVDLEQRQPALAPQPVERLEQRRRHALDRGGSRASRSPSRARARAGPPGTPTATSARGARGSRRRTSWHAVARRSRRSAPATSRASIRRVASSTSTHACLSQSSEDWWTVWNRSSSRCAHSSGPLLEREQLLGAQVALVVARRRAPRGSARTRPGRSAISSRPGATRCRRRSSSAGRRAGRRRRR